MEMSLLALALLFTLPVCAAPEMASQQNTSTIIPAQIYLDAALTLEHQQQVAEGMLAYAEQYAAGKTVHVISSNTGITLYSFDNNQAQIISEVPKTQLGVADYESVRQILVSPDDKWIMLNTYNRIISIPLSDTKQPLLSRISTEPQSGYYRLQLAGNLLLLPGYSEIKSYSVAADTGYLTEQAALQLANPSDQIAATSDTLVVGFNRWDALSPNLAVYRLVDNQWQLIAEHQFGAYDSAQVNYVAINPQGNRIAYGSYSDNAILNFDPTTNTLTPLHSDITALNNGVDNIAFLNETTLLVRRYSTFSSINSESLQTFGTFEFNPYSSGPMGLSIAETSFSFMNNQGIFVLNNADLAIQNTLQPGDIDVVYPFGNNYAHTPLGDDYLLATTNTTQVLLYKFDEQGIPQPVHSTSTQQLLGFDITSFNVLELDAQQRLYLLSHSDNYTVVKLDTDTDSLQLLSQGTLTDANDQGVYIDSHKVAVVNNQLIVAGYDTLYAFKRDQANKLQFDLALKEGISGTSGISSINFLLAHNDHVYTIDNQHQTIAHFTLSNGSLVQAGEYNNFRFSTAHNYVLRNNLLTLQSSNLLHVFQLSPAGEVTEHSTQFSELGSNSWVTLGERFVATADWNALRILEQEPATGIWGEGLTLDAQMLKQTHDMASFRLVQGVDGLLMYDSQKRQLNVFSHNSAPYATDISHLNLQLNQGKAAEFNLTQAIRDDEDSLLTYTLQGANPAFALTEQGTLSFNGDLGSAGNFDVLAEDPALLGSQIRFNYSVNLAPVLKAASPVFNAEQGKSFHFDLASYYTDPEGQAIRFTTTSSPTGVSLSETGILAGTFADAAEITIVFSTTDSAGATAQHSVTAMVAAKPEESSGGTVSWWLALALGMLAAGRRLTARH